MEKLAKKTLKQKIRKQKMKENEAKVQCKNGEEKKRKKRYMTAKKKGYYLKLYFFIYWSSIFLRAFSKIIVMKQKLFGEKKSKFSHFPNWGRIEKHLTLSEEWGKGWEATQKIQIFSSGGQKK